MEQIRFNKSELEELMGQIMNYADNTRNWKLGDAVRMVDGLLNLDEDHEQEFNDFLEASKNEGYDFVIEYFHKATP